jgi:shikimate kinase
MARVVLVGLPGAGKTTVGRAVAASLGIDFRDSDDLVTERAGQSPADFLRRGAVAEFRAIERDVIVDALQDDIVLATGGGALTTPEVRDDVRTQCVVWLDAPDGILAIRAATGDRPLLGDDHEQRLAELRLERSPFYDDVACCRVDTSGELIDVVRAVCERLQETSC